ncbi:MAG: SDR family NAD(P)-dependent oxidoreductase, partial [Flavobacteriaceae bacterium]|nr:SDR family NAD(P)-dependent oxidoreductase [Flavobacteriaceae bacterium]
MAVIGCGWLGLPLAKLLVKKGYSVRGTTTTNSKIPLLETAGIEPYLISLGERKVEGPATSFLQGIDTLVINV